LQLATATATATATAPLLSSSPSLSEAAKRASEIQLKKEAKKARFILEGVFDLERDQHCSRY
jgi:hypothetical protein